MDHSEEAATSIAKSLKCLTSFLEVATQNNERYLKALGELNTDLNVPPNSLIAIKTLASIEASCQSIKNSVDLLNGLFNELATLQLVPQISPVPFLCLVPQSSPSTPNMLTSPTTYSMQAEERQTEAKEETAEYSNDNELNIKDIRKMGDSNRPSPALDDTKRREPRTMSSYENIKRVFSPSTPMKASSNRRMAMSSSHVKENKEVDYDAVLASLKPVTPQNAVKKYNDELLGVFMFYAVKDTNPLVKSGNVIQRKTFRSICKDAGLYSLISVQDIDLVFDASKNSDMSELLIMTNKEKKEYEQAKKRYLMQMEAEEEEEGQEVDENELRLKIKISTQLNKVRTNGLTPNDFGFSMIRLGELLMRCVTNVTPVKMSDTADVPMRETVKRIISGVDDMDYVTVDKEDFIKHSTANALSSLPEDQQSERIITDYVKSVTQYTLRIINGFVLANCNKIAVTTDEKNETAEEDATASIKKLEEGYTERIQALFDEQKRFFLNLYKSQASMETPLSNARYVLTLEGMTNIYKRFLLSSLISMRELFFIHSAFATTTDRYDKTAVDFEGFKKCLFALANIGLSRPEFIRTYPTPEQRVEKVIEMIILFDVK